jgi:hypothetical protein
VTFAGFIILILSCLPGYQGNTAFKIETAKDFEKQPGCMDFSLGSRISAEPCTLSFSWSLGQIDPRFRVTEDHVLDAMQGVVDLWAAAVDSLHVQQLDSGGVTVRLVYDERQERTDREMVLRENLGLMREQIDRMKEEHDRMLGQYVNQSAEYLQLVTVYEGRFDRLNEWIEGINQAGGFSETEREQLREQRVMLREMQLLKQNMQVDLNKLVDDTNDLTIRLNQAIHERNQLVADYNRDFAYGNRFVSGTYERRSGRSTITVYQFMTLRELKLVLAHEFGHALGIDHVPNSRSIMYELMADQSIYSDIELSEEDKAAARALCRNAE